MADAPPSPPSWDGWKRLAVTLACAAGWIAVPRLAPGIPGVDLSGPQGEALRTSENFGVFALGLMPVVSAMALVELIAVTFPRLRPLRHGGPVGRARLSWTSAVLALVLAMFQGFGIAKLTEALSPADASMVVHPGWGFRIVTMLTLAAGTALALVLTQAADVRGLASGIAVATIVPGVGRVLGNLSVSVVEGRTTGLSAAGTLGAAILTVAVTWLALRDPRSEPGANREPSGDHPPARGAAPAPLSIPAPASGVVVIVGGSSLVSLLSMAGGDRILRAHGRYDAVTVVFVLSVGAAFAWMFNTPTRVASVLSRARAEGAVPAAATRRDPEILRAARRAMREATLRSLVLLGALLAIPAIHRVATNTLFATLDFALLTALVLDVAAELRARRETPDLVPVWPEHRPYAVAAAREALDHAGIPLFARGEKLRRLLQFAGPYVPIDLMVPRADATRAAEILDRVLRYHAEDEKDAPAETRPSPAPWAPLERVLLAATAVLAIVPVAVAAWPAPAPPPRRAVRADTLQFLEVDDDDDLFSPEPADLLQGVSLRVESAPVGPGRNNGNHYACLIAGDAAGLAAARSRLLSWAELLAKARGLSVRVGPIEEWDEEQEKFVQAGWRTYVVRGGPILDARDVVNATAEPTADRTRLQGWTVRVQLGADGAERFRAFTAAHVKRRLAIVVDGMVESAPVIITEIPSGVVSITMGSGGPEQQRGDAKRLADRLMGR
jgi:preprotein translocase subunit SecY